MIIKRADRVFSVRSFYLFDPLQLRFDGFGFRAFRVDVVSCDAEMLAVDQLDLCAPAPVGSTIGGGITAEDGESLFFGIARAKHDGGIVVETVHPAGFVLVEGGVVAEREHAVLRFTVNGALIKKKCKATLEQQLNRPDDGRLTGKFPGLKPKLACASPVTGKLGEEVVRGI